MSSEGAVEKIARNVAVLASLQSLFEQAERENLWFHSSYQDMWFSPQELRNKQENGRFIWGLMAWELLDPKLKLSRLEASITEAVLDRDRFRDRMEKAGLTEEPR